MTVLDHFAIGTSALADGWDLFGGILGGTWAYGGDSRGYWWGQLDFASGPKIELLTPTGGPDAAFLERFLAARGAGPHHFNFITADIDATLARVRTLGIDGVAGEARTRRPTTVGFVTSMGPLRARAILLEDRSNPIGIERAFGHGPLLDTLRLRFL